MKNLFKNVFRSFSKTKTAIVALFFLMFLSLGVFAVLDNTSHNLNNSYVSLVKKGNLNDFVVNEKYDYGPMQFDALDNSTGQPVTETITVGTPITIKLSDDSKNYLVQNAYNQNKAKYEKYYVGFIMPWPTNIGALTPYEYVISQLNDTSLIFGNLLKNDYNINVRSELDSLGLTYRNYESLEITDGNKLKKIVNSNPQDKINKLVIYEGDQLSQSMNDLFLVYQNIYQKIHDANSASFLSDPVANSIDPSTHLPTIQENQLISFYQALKINADPNADSSLVQIINILNTAIQNNGKLTNVADQNQLYQIFGSNSQFTNEGYAWNILWNNTHVISMIDPTSFEVIISPSNWKYLSSEKAIYSNTSEWDNIKTKSSKEINNWIKNLDPRYKIKIGSIEYLIRGVGLTPDFMYPVFNISSLVPDPQNQELYFTNNNGYGLIHKSFLTNPIEKYIVGKFNSSSTSQQQLDELNQINNWASTNMSWPSNVKSAYLSTDQSNYLNLNAIRTTFVTSLINTITLVSGILTSVILGLALFVGILVIVNYMRKNKFSFAVLQSNGYPKHKIAFSLLPFSTIPIIVGSVCGYLVGFSLQRVALNIFSNYWFIPTYISALNPLVFLVTIIFPVIFFLLFTFLAGLFFLRSNVVQSLKNDSDYKISRFALIMKTPFSAFSVLTRFRAAIAFNAFLKLIVLSILSGSVMVVSNFALSSIGLFDRARQNTINSHRYEYAIDLETPTEQSGILKYQPLSSLGRTDAFTTTDNPEYFMNNSSYDVWNWGSQNVKSQKFQWDNIHITNINDMTYQTSNITYLKNLVQSKIMLDYTINGLGSTTNPWSLSSSLMPVNQMAASNYSYQKLLEAIYTDPKTTPEEKIENEKYIVRTPSIDDPTKITYSINSQNAVNSTLSIIFSGVLKSDYLKWLNNNLNKLENQYFIDEKGQPILDYKISYNVIGLDNQTIGNTAEYKNGVQSPKYSYTRIDAIDKNANTISIKGIKNWIKNQVIPDDYLGPVLSDSKKNIINEKLFNSSVNNPIIINLYTAKKYNLSIGSEITLDVINTYDRITRKHNKELTNIPVTFTVVDICNSAKDNEIYISYENANKILGFPQDVINKNLAFNGVYSQTLNTLDYSTSLFSASGLFPGTSSFDSSNNLMLQIIKSTLNNYNPSSDNLNSLNTKNFKALEKALCRTLNKTDDPAKCLQELNSLYSGLPYTTMIDYIDNSGSNNQLFNTIAQTTTTIQNIVIGIVLPIAVLIVILISNMLIEELRKIGIKLKALGLTTKEILLSFLSIYVPVFFIGLIVSIPVALGLISQYNTIVFNASNIALLASLSPITVLISMVGLTLLFSLSFIINWFVLRKLSITQEMKSF
ncbi:ABC transporter permease [Mycoplasmoides alvi]|uniref:ABC transporter permease n=1 Tax=Mycoplasmoides alvi TaxID=78580 RepID=UPI00051AB27B|nr:ABC transporter permease [Mycoplasmoides alvi]